MAAYKVEYVCSNGRRITAISDHVPCFNYVVRIPGTEMYGVPVSMVKVVAAGETCRNPHCAGCDAGIEHEDN